MILHKKTEKSSVAPVHPGKVVRRRRIFTLFFAQECTRQTEPRRPISPSRLSGLDFRCKTRGRFTAPHIVLAHRSFALWNALKFSYSPHFHSIFRPFIHTIRKILSYGFKFSPHTGQIDTLFLTISHLTVPELIIPILQYILTNINSNNGKEKTLSLNLESQKEVLKENAPMQTYVLKAGAITVRGNLIYTPAHKPHDGGKHFAAMAENHKVDGCAIKYMGGYEINDLAKSVYTEREISWLKKEQSFWAICTRFSNGLEFFK